MIDAFLWTFLKFSGKPLCNLEVNICLYVGECKTAFSQNNIFVVVWNEYTSLLITLLFSLELSGLLEDKNEERPYFKLSILSLLWIEDYMHKWNYLLHIFKLVFSWKAKKIDQNVLFFFNFMPKKHETTSF